MSPQQQQGQADPKLALQYLGEIAQTYSEGLKPVEKAPFINQVNVCIQVLNKARESILAEVERVQSELLAAQKNAKPKKG